MEPQLNIAPSTRRLKMVYVLREDILRVYFEPQGVWTTRIAHPKLPDGVKVESVYWSYNPAAFCFILSHESFPEVPPSELIPVFTDWAQPEIRTHSQALKDTIVMKTDSELRELKELVAAELYDRERMVKDKQR